MANLNDVLDQDASWPTLSDKLFSRGRYWAGEAFTATDPSERTYHSTKGYKLGADLLVEHTEDEAWSRRKLVYPIVFGYRQFLELTLKAMIEEYGPLGGVPPVWSHHRLEDLWRDFERLLRNWGVADQEDGSTDAV